MRFLGIVFLLVNFNSNAQNLNLITIRDLYEKSATDKITCQKLVKALKNYNEINNPSKAGYRACATMMMANYLINPVQKLSSFNQGKSLLEKCIQKDKTNIELRYLRFSVQSNAPSFLGYYEHLKEDKKFLIQNVVNLDDENLKKKIITFLLSNVHVTSSEKEKLK